MFQPIYRCFKKVGHGDHVSKWQSKGLSDENTKPLATSDNSLAPSLDYIVLEEELNLLINA